MIHHCNAFVQVRVSIPGRSKCNIEQRVITLIVVVFFFFFSSPPTFTHPPLPPFLCPTRRPQVFAIAIAFTASKPVRADAPSIEAGPNGIVLNVDAGSKIYLRQGSGELEELVTVTAMRGLEDRLTARLAAVEAAAKAADHSTRIDAAETAISALQDAVKAADHSTRIDALDASAADADARLDAVEKAAGESDQSEKIEEIAQGLAVVEKELAESETVADFKQDFLANLGKNPPSGANGQSANS